MNVFWANAYEETWDPVIGKLAAESREVTATREYDGETNAFRNPQVYLYNGLVPQQRMSGDQELREVMLRHLGASFLTVRDRHGVRTPVDTIGCAWAYDQTRDRGYADAAWNVAQMLADLVPDAECDPDRPVEFCIRGNMYYRHFLMPILVGASLGDRLGFAKAPPPRFGDLYALMQPASPRDRTPRLTAWVRPRRAGSLALRVFLRGDPGKPVAFEVNDPDDKQVARLSLTPKPGAPKNRFYPRDRNSAEGRLTIPGTRKGAIYRVDIASEGRRGNVRLLGDADVVYQFLEGDQHAVTSMAGGQYYTGTRIYTKALRDTITVEMNSNVFHRPFVIRDAHTGELIHRYALGEPLKTTHEVGAGRMLEFLMAGARAYRAWRVEGASPYYAARREEWFDPKAR